MSTDRGGREDRRGIGAFKPEAEFGLSGPCAIADWLDSCGVKTVAMERTGVYWVPLFEVLDEGGFQVKLVDARIKLVDAGKVKNVSGRKSDVADCQWLQQLESYGLLTAAYRPAERARCGEVGGNA
jgi:transposase